MANDIGGVWRTIGGRRVFIKDGQDLASAMKESGKFKKLKIKDVKHDERITDGPREKYINPLEEEKAWDNTPMDVMLDEYYEYLNSDKEDFIAMVSDDYKMSEKQAEKLYEKLVNSKEYKERNFPKNESIIKMNGKDYKISNEPDEDRVYRLENTKDPSDFKYMTRGELSYKGIEMPQPLESTGLPDVSPNEPKPTVRNTNVEFSTYQYRASHGKEPKGAGRWAFSTDRAGDDMFFAPYGMTYTEAKRWAIKEMNKRGKKVTTLYVGS